MKLAFVSRHVPTPRQYELARGWGYELVPVGDRDAFAGDVRWSAFPGYAGVVVDHPAAALRALIAESGYGQPQWMVGVFENVNRAPEGAPHSWETVALHMYFLASDCPETTFVRQLSANPGEFTIEL